MPIPHAMRRVNRVALNKVTRQVAPWLPGLGVVIHRGAIRRAGRLTGATVDPVINTMSIQSWPA